MRGTILVSLEGFLMKKVVLLLLTILVSIGFSISAQAADSIVGYGQYKLGMDVAELDLVPNVVCGDGWLANDTGVYYKNVSMPVSPGDEKSVRAGLLLFTADNKLERICLNFGPCNKDLDNNSGKLVSFVKSLRASLLEKYDGARVQKDEFDYGNFEGSLELVDNQKNVVNLVWGEKFKYLSVSYYTAEMWEIEGEATAERQRKLAQGEAVSVDDL